MKLEHTVDFTNGVRIGQSEIEKWHKHVIDLLLKGTGKTASVKSGNSMVIGQLSISEEDTEPKITIYEIMDGYKQYEYSDIKK